MFLTSSQKKHWLFSNEDEIVQLRESANKTFIEKSMKSNIDYKNYFLTSQEEFILYQNYQFYLRDFCRKFQPPMPKCVVGTSFNYFKRFYLHNSVMDYHPYEILLTCIYLASKVEEFNISIAQFVANLKRDREKTIDIILNSELLLMQQLNYQLTIHNPYRPVEGFIIDIKTRCPFIEDPEMLRPGIDEFLDHSYLTDVCLLFPPSQIALAAILSAASKIQENLVKYIKDVLLEPKADSRCGSLIEALERIRKMVKNIEIPQSSAKKAIEKKLEKCRNPENNPESQIYKRKLQEMFDDEGGRSARKYARLAEERQREQEELLGMSEPK